MGKIMADYVHLPKFDEYKEWFKDHFELYREDGILQVTMHTNGHEMCWSGANHRAMSQLSHTIGADPENEETAFLKDFVFTCLLAFDISLKKRMIESVIDRMKPVSAAKAAASDKKTAAKIKKKRL